MADFFPSQIREEAEPGEKLVFDVLQRALADRPDWIVWSEPQSFEPRTDFVLWAPNFGLLLLEVKDCTPGFVGYMTMEKWSVGWREPRDPRTNPAFQARKCKSLLRKKLLARRILHRPWQRGELAFPTNHAVVFTNCTLLQAEAAGWLETLPDDCGLFFREDLESDLSTPASRDIFVERLDALRRYKYPASFPSALTRVVKQVIFPEVGATPRHVPVAEDIERIGVSIGLAAPLAIKPASLPDRMAAEPAVSRPDSPVPTRVLYRSPLRRVLSGLKPSGFFRSLHRRSNAKPNRRPAPLMRWFLGVFLVAVLIAIGTGRWRNRYAASPPPAIRNGVSLTISPVRIHPGQNAMLRWSAPGATRVLLDGRSVNVNGTRVFAQATSTTHHLVAFAADGSPSQAQARVIVLPSRHAVRARTAANDPSGLP